jgi:DNA (cytosine-5)-methyltransferase 1
VTVISQFCGIGTTFALHAAGLTDIGIDNEPTIEQTRKSLGWTDTICADILDLNPHDYAGAEGLTSSPPCQSWSRAGKGAGLDDPRGQLVWQPLVWALAIRPRWVMCEQVPEARGAFELIAHRLREVGYHAVVYELSSETFGVPQTRRRVHLVAHRDFEPHRPTLTHQRYRKGRPRITPVDMLGHLPWVSMAEALGPTFDHLEVDRHQTDVDPRPCTEPAPTLTAAAIGRTVWTLQNRRDSAAWIAAEGERPNRQANEPAPTITGEAGRWLVAGGWWPAERPATTICADPRISPPQHHHGSQNAGAVPYEDAANDRPVALTEHQGCTLMAYPPGTHQHLQGTKADRWRTIGNGCCPPVITAILATIHR